MLRYKSILNAHSKTTGPFHFNRFFCFRVITAEIIVKTNLNVLLQAEVRPVCTELIHRTCSKNSRLLLLRYVDRLNYFTHEI